MLKKIALASILLYGLQFWLLEIARRADQDRCKGWQCEAVWCPDTYSIQAPNGDYVRCENLTTYLKDNNL